MNKNNGFSIQELVVVISGFSILALISFPKISDFIKDFKINHAKNLITSIVRQCVEYSEINDLDNPTFSDIGMGMTLNPYEDSYGIDYGDHDGFTYNTTISSAMPTREYSSCMRLSAKSTSIRGLGDETGYHYPHFEIMYNSFTGEYEKNCVLQINAYNKPRHCNADTLSW
jgi:competence protein ComGC